jgi:hypothetical protein
VIPLTRTSDHTAAVEYGLRAVERGLVHKRLEVTLRTLRLPWASSLPTGAAQVPYTLTVPTMQAPAFKPLTGGTDLFIVYD